jgi:hypothetical protein
MIASSPVAAIPANLGIICERCRQNEVNRTSEFADADEPDPRWRAGYPRHFLREDSDRRGDLHEAHHAEHAGQQDLCDP